MTDAREIMEGQIGKWPTTYMLDALKTAGFRILGPDEIDGPTVEKCAEVVEPLGDRPCDCERCDCGNAGDLEMVSAWDQQRASATAIRALKEKRT